LNQVLFRHEGARELARFSSSDAHGGHGKLPPQCFRFVPVPTGLLGDGDELGVIRPLGFVFDGKDRLFKPIDRACSRPLLAFRSSAKNDIRVVYSKQHVARAHLGHPDGSTDLLFLFCIKAHAQTPFGLRDLIPL
jgi:hypothetical protein